MGMSQDEGPEGEDIVNELVAIFIPNSTSLSLLNERGLSPYCPKGTHGAIHPPRDIFSGFLKELT